MSDREAAAQWVRTVMDRATDKHAQAAEIFVNGSHWHILALREWIAANKPKGDYILHVTQI